MKDPEEDFVGGCEIELDCDSETAVDGVRSR